MGQSAVFYLHTASGRGHFTPNGHLPQGGTRWAQPELAQFYGAKHPGSGLAKVQLDPEQRGGILTQGAWLVSHGKKGRDNVVRRGMSIYRQAMCHNSLTPPAGHTPA